MSDAIFDGSRAAGEYPPKGWGWQSEAWQRQEVARQLVAGMEEPWLMREARRLGVTVVTTESCS
jgi:hypothetical protein